MINHSTFTVGPIRGGVSYQGGCLPYLHGGIIKYRSIRSSAILAFFAFHFSFLLYGNAFAGAWVQEKGSALSITTIKWYESDEYRDQDRHINDAPDYHKLETNPLLEYGVTANLTLGINAFIPYIDAGGQGSNFGLGDVEILGRYQLWKDDYSALSTQLLLKIPEAYNAHKLPLLGLGQYDLEWRLLYGHGWAWFNGQWMYINTEAGFRKRFGAPADEVRFDWMLGWKSPGQKWEIDFKQENIFGLRNNNSTTQSDPYREQSSDYDLNKATLSVLYWVFPKIALQAGISKDIYGRNTGNGIAPFTALWVRF
jgi:protein XagA